MVLRMARVLGALTLLGVGAVHLQQYLEAGYGSVPTIGTLFLLNAIGAAVVAVGLLVPIERIVPGRNGGLTVGALALGGVAIAAGSLIALFIAESRPLFGFQEFGSGAPITLAIATEAATVVLLVPVVVANAARTVSSPRGQRRGEALEPR